MCSGSGGMTTSDAVVSAASNKLEFSLMLLPLVCFSLRRRSHSDISQCYCRECEEIGQRATHRAGAGVYRCTRLWTHQAGRGLLSNSHLGVSRESQSDEAQVDVIGGLGELLMNEIQSK